MAELIPDDFLRAIGIWSLIPSYLIAGGFIGYGLDRWLDLFPILTCIGMLLALALAVRDMMRLKDTFPKSQQPT
ncbi:MAG: AtpZ/AtpI family protein [Coriobacteriia bacterium]|nr:AtpZ/AtpI family protein [Coriobacteriia bacterium]